MADSLDFIPFLIRAKRSTYSSGLKYPQTSRPGSRDMQYEEKPFLYIDTYLGGFNFIGEEAVWKDGKYIWGMNYYGRMLVDQIPEDFAHFLQASLSLVPETAPYRGPEKHSSGGYSYTCSWTGTPDVFSGIEEITLQGIPVYRLMFHGGKVCDETID